ncbi:MAG TPA: YfiR family protein, partial [Opitutaceae bacterium]|nr:YfiR family protein [Opitutaceae bacterium]
MNQRAQLDGGSARRTSKGFTALRAAVWARSLAMVVALLGIGALAPARASAQLSRESDLKAVLLYNLTQFVEWPSSAFAQPDSPVVIGILGRDPFGTVLDDIVRNEKSGERNIVVQRFRNVQAARDCHILFVSSSEEFDFPRILRMLRGRPVLTVGDFEAFGTRGGMIRFMTNPQGKIHLR